MKKIESKFFFFNMVEIEKHVNPPLSPLQPFKDKIDEYVEIMFAATFWIPFPIVYSRDLVNLDNMYMEIA